ncbi:MAG: GspE/PulE family protein [Elusimicrobiota bacterium]
MKTLNINVNKQLLKKIPIALVYRWGVIPLEKNKSGHIVVGFLDPENLECLDNLHVIFSEVIEPVQLTTAEFQELVQMNYGFGSQNDSANIVQFVESLMIKAVELRASDIHFESIEQSVTLRLRIDGILKELPLLEELKERYVEIVSHIKISSQMNIVEKRRPQDGRFSFNIKNEKYDVRVSTLPTQFGENLNLRILHRNMSLQGLKELGMAEKTKQQIESLINKPTGLFLVTGPTGSGKTTTLYSCLSQLDSSRKKIITLEEPIEYNLRNITQTQIQPKLDYTFSKGLRAILRQDPDVMMVGEMRDQETAELAIRASFTGHFVFSTLHTNDAVSAITRLIDMGVEPYLISSALTAVLSQRLVRQICIACSGTKKENCPFCLGDGFYERTGIFEVLVISDEMKPWISEKLPEKEWKVRLKNMGYQTFWDDGLNKVRDRITSIEELKRVVNEEV